MAASWHTMAVISCPILFTHFTEFPLGLNTSVLGGRVWILLTTSSCKLDAVPRVWCQLKTPNFGISHPARGCLCWFGTVEGWPRWSEPGTLVPASAVHPLLLVLQIATTAARCGAGMESGGESREWEVWLQRLPRLNSIPQGIICNCWVGEWKREY